MIGDAKFEGLVSVLYLESRYSLQHQGTVIDIHHIEYNELSKETIAMETRAKVQISKIVSLSFLRAGSDNGRILSRVRIAFTADQTSQNFETFDFETKEVKKAYEWIVISQRENDNIG